MPFQDQQWYVSAHRVSSRSNLFVSVYYHTACSYPNCKPEDVIGCAAAQSDHTRFMKWPDMKQVIEVSDDDENDKTSKKDKVASPSPKAPPRPPMLLHCLHLACFSH